MGYVVTNYFIGPILFLKIGTLFRARMDYHGDNDILYVFCLHDAASPVGFVWTVRYYKKG